MRRLTRREAGASAVTFAITMTAVGGFLALSLNVGNLMSVRGQLQNVTDAAALAGAGSLDGTSDGLTSARDNADDFGERHSTNRLPVSLDRNDGNAAAGDIVLGHWDYTAPKVFTHIADPAADPLEINAVLVRTGRDASRGNALTVFFSGMLGGTSSAGVSAEAVAVRGGPCADCSVPFVFPDCVIAPDDTLNCGAQLVFSSAIQDNFGFSSLGTGPTNVNTVKNILDSDCSEIDVGETVSINNGNFLTPGANGIVAAIENYIARNGPQVTAPIVHLSCPNPQFNQDAEVVGFATFTILSVQGPPNQMLTIRLDCEETDEDPGPTGCANFGTTTLTTRLIR